MLEIKSRCVKVSQSAVFQRVIIRYRGAQNNLDLLQSRDKYAPELSVHLVNAENFLKGSSVLIALLAYRKGCEII